MHGQLRMLEIDMARGYHWLQEYEEDVARLRMMTYQLTKRGNIYGVGLTAAEVAIWATFKENIALQDGLCETVWREC